VAETDFPSAQVGRAPVMPRRDDARDLARHAAAVRAPRRGEGVPRPSLVLVVSTYDNPTALESCLLGVMRQTLPPTRVVVADDGSGDETRQVIERYRRRVSLEHVWQEDAGFRLAAIRNRAVARCAEDYLVFLDGDTVPHRHFVRDHAEVARRGRVILGQRCAIVGFHGRVLHRRPGGVVGLIALFLARRVLNDSRALGTGLRSRFAGLRKGVRLPRGVLQPCTHRETHGGNLGVWRDDLLAVNGFDERFVGWGGEDRDFTYRLMRAGREPCRLLYRAVCYHIDHPAHAANARNGELLRQTERPIRCVQGVDRYL
jgi:glycosyltransferase involved in cell wall biosynthesis